jgi:hypothetical protein
MCVLAIVAYHAEQMVSLEGSNIDTLLAAYSGPSFDSFALLASNDDCPASSDLYSCLVFSATVGVTYWYASSGVFFTPMLSSLCSGTIAGGVSLGMQVPG